MIRRGRSGWRWHSQIGKDAEGGLFNDVLADGHAATEHMRKQSASVLPGLPKRPSFCGFRYCLGLAQSDFARHQLGKEEVTGGG